jgi:hypothetical protein
MAIERLNPFQCDALGCGALRTTVNHWFVAIEDETGVHVYRWSKAPRKAMAEGFHFSSSSLTPNKTPDPQRESTLKLKPPLTREGKKVE